MSKSAQQWQRHCEARLKTTRSGDQAPVSRASSHTPLRSIFGSNARNTTNRVLQSNLQLHLLITMLRDWMHKAHASRPWPQLFSEVHFTQAPTRHQAHTQSHWRPSTNTEHHRRTNRSRATPSKATSWQSNFCRDLNNAVCRQKRRGSTPESRRFQNVAARAEIQEHLKSAG